MATIEIEEVGGKTLEQAQRLLAGIEGGANKAVKNAMQRAASHLRSNAGKAIRERYDISQAALRANENVSIRYTYQNGIQAYVKFAGHKIPLYRYGGSSPKQPTPNGSAWVSAHIDGFWKQVHPSLSATGHQLKRTSPYRFDNAFVARMRSGHIGIFERTGAAGSNGNDAIRELMGSSVPQMLGSKEVEERLAKETAEKFEERLQHEITRILNGY